MVLPVIQRRGLQRRRLAPPRLLLAVSMVMGVTVGMVVRVIVRVTVRMSMSMVVTVVMIRMVACMHLAAAGFHRREGLVCMIHMKAQFSGHHANGFIGQRDQMIVFHHHGLRILCQTDGCLQQRICSTGKLEHGLNGGFHNGPAVDFSHQTVTGLYAFIQMQKCGTAIGELHIVRGLLSRSPVQFKRRRVFQKHGCNLDVVCHNACEHQVVGTVCMIVSAVVMVVVMVVRVCLRV